MRPRLRRLLSKMQRPAATVPRASEAKPVQDLPSDHDTGSGQTERRLEDAQRRLKQTVSPRPD
jgi:hypothetical protein